MLEALGNGKPPTSYEIQDGKLVKFSIHSLDFLITLKTS